MGATIERYTPNEIAALGQAAGFAPRHLKTYDVYDDKFNSGIAEMLIQRGDNSIKRETIFTLEAKYPRQVRSRPTFFGNPRTLAGNIEVREVDPKNGLVEVVQQIHLHLGGLTREYLQPVWQ